MRCFLKQRAGWVRGAAGHRETDRPSLLLTLPLFLKITAATAAKAFSQPVKPGLRPTVKRQEFSYSQYTNLDLLFRLVNEAFLEWFSS